MAASAYGGPFAAVVIKLGQWDNNGNLTDRGSDDFTWDVEDRLTSAKVGSTTTTFAYNGDGLRDSLTVNSNTTTFTWDMNRSVAQVLDDEDFRYVYGAGRIAQVSGSSAHFYLSDGLSSTLALVDGRGVLANTYDYDVFGAVRALTGSQVNAFKFTGEQVDASTGLEYLRARYYDMATGRFISTDPFGGLAFAPESLNPYAYAWNSPTNLTDPDGEFPWGLCAVGAAVNVGIDALTGEKMTVPNVAKSAAMGCGSGLLLGGAGRWLPKVGSWLSPSRKISRIAQRHADQGLPHLLGALSEKERFAYLADPRKGSRFLGQAVHRLTAQTIKDNFLYRVRGPDFEHNITKRLIELTTKSQMGIKQAKPGYEGVDIATYVLP